MYQLGILGKWHEYFGKNANPFRISVVAAFRFKVIICSGAKRTVLIFGLFSLWEIRSFYAKNSTRNVI